MEQKILDLFLYNHSLKFNEIEKKIGERSNKLAYHLKNLADRGILTKQGEKYFLSDTAETLIPYLSKNRAVLPVVLVHIGNRSKVFLHIREKRPYKGFYSLPGGRILLGESIEEATKRIMREKVRINVKFRRVNSICLEHVRSKGKILHSFLLIFVSASTKDKITLIDAEKNKKKIIKSDFWLIRNFSNSKIRVEKFNSKIK